MDTILVEMADLSMATVATAQPGGEKQEAPFTVDAATKPVIAAPLVLF